MAELVINEVENIESQTSFLETLNANLRAIADAINNKLDRTDNDENTMGVTLDMNSQRITNIGPPVSSSDAARWIDLYSVSEITGYVVPALAGNSGRVLTNDGMTLSWSATITGLQPDLNLSDLTNVSEARGHLGLGTAAVYNVGATGSNIPVLSSPSTWSGFQTYQAGVSFQGGGTFGGTTDYRVTTTNLTTLEEDSIGFRGAPQKIKDQNYSFVLDDAGRGITHTSATPHAWTIEPDSTTNHPVHTIIILDNKGSGAVTVTRGSGVALRVNSSGTSANQTLPQYYVRSIYKEAPNAWVMI